MFEVTSARNYILPVMVAATISKMYVHLILYFLFFFRLIYFCFACPDLTQCSIAESLYRDGMYVQ
jgi:hypothetical protein